MAFLFGFQSSSSSVPSSSSRSRNSPLGSAPVVAPPERSSSPALPRRMPQQETVSPAWLKDKYETEARHDAPQNHPVVASSVRTIPPAPPPRSKRFSCLALLFGLGLLLLLCLEFLQFRPALVFLFCTPGNNNNNMDTTLLSIQQQLEEWTLPRQQRSSWSGATAAALNRTTPLRRTTMVKSKTNSSSKSSSSSSSFFITRAETMVDKHIYDAYSGAWWGSTDLFVSKWQNPDIMKAIFASFYMFRKVAGDKHVYMTRDWMNFHVEHLSHFFKYSTKSVRLEPPQYSFEIHVQKQWEYMQKAAVATTATAAVSQSPSGFPASDASKRKDDDQNPFTETIALLPYYRSLKPGYKIVLDSAHVPEGKAREKYLYMLSISTTIASLARNGIPRIVIAGNTQQCPIEIQHAVTLFQRATSNVWTITSNVYNDNSSSNQQKPPASNRHIEIDYVSIFGLQDKENLHTPTYALEQLLKAFKGQMPKDRRDEWLGKNDHPSIMEPKLNSESDSTTYNNGRWKYIYFSEPDLILHARLEPETLAIFRQAMDTRNVLAPHRLQLLTHASDFPLDAAKHPEEYIPAVGRHAMAMDLYLDQDSCCDAGNYWPGKDNTLDDGCGLPNVLWWRCGQRISTNNQQQKQGQNKTKQRRKATVVESDIQRYAHHQRLQFYPHIRLGDGMKVTAVQEHARMCIPQPRGTCEINDTP